MILTPENIWIVGITQEPSTREYYLVFYYDVYAILDTFIRNSENLSTCSTITFMNSKRLDLVVMEPIKLSIVNDKKNKIVRLC